MVERLTGIMYGGDAFVACLVEKPGVGIHALRERVRVCVGQGFEGDHVKKSWWKGAEVPGREVTAMAMEVLRAIDCAPEVPGDNLITEGVNLAALQDGDFLEIGEVRLRRSTEPHRPCDTFARRTSNACMKAVQQTSTRGALFTVERGGVLKMGQQIQIRSGQEAESSSRSA